MALSRIPFLPGRLKLENFQVGALMYFCSRCHNKHPVLQNKFFEFLLAVLHRSFELLYRIAETLIAIRAIFNINSKMKKRILIVLNSWTDRILQHRVSKPFTKEKSLWLKKRLHNWWTLTFSKATCMRNENRCMLKVCECVHREWIAAMH